jgi:hypothetical protein
MSRDDINEVCNVRIVARCTQTQDIVAERVGHNVWTNTGREYSCMLKTYAPNLRLLRNDRISYVGVGTGAQPEAVGVSRLVEPIAYRPGRFLKAIDHNLTTFPTSDGPRTAVRFVVKYGLDDLSYADSAFISECGLFTDGNQDTFVSGGRDTTSAAATTQSPVAYHSFDPIPKSANVELEIIWELRH